MDSEEERIKNIKALISNGVSKETIAESFNLSIEEVNKLLEC